MERPLFRASAVCLALSLCLCTMVAQGDLVKNGDFSLPTGDPTAAPGNWVVTMTSLPSDGFSGVVRVESGVFDEYMYFGIGDACVAGTTLTLGQTISLDPGQYRLCFNFTFDTSGGQGVYESDTFRVLLKGDPEVVTTNHLQPAGFSVDFSDSGNPYCLTFPLAHSEPSFLLEFQLDRDRVMDGVGTIVRLDNVELSEVSAVPVPSAAILGAIGLSCAGWRFKRGNT